MPVDYQNSKIYKIEPTCDHNEGDIYIGSTSRVRLCDRWDNHKSKHKNGKNSTTSRILFNKYGISNCRIVLIEAFPCNSKEELISKEAHFIQTVLCINKVIPVATNMQKQIQPTTYNISTFDADNAIINLCNFIKKEYKTVVYDTTNNLTRASTRVKFDTVICTYNEYCSDNSLSLNMDYNTKAKFTKKMTALGFENERSHSKVYYTGLQRIGV